MALELEARATRRRSGGGSPPLRASTWYSPRRSGHATDGHLRVTSAPAPQTPRHTSPPCGDPWQRVRHAQPLHRALTCRDATRMRACPTVRPPRRVTRCGRATSAAARPAMRTAHSSGASCTAVAGATAVHETLVARRICHAAREQIHGPRRAAPVVVPRFAHGGSRGVPWGCGVPAPPVTRALACPMPSLSHSRKRSVHIW